MDTPPDDSIFSAPIWRKGFRDPGASRIQMNPSLAYSQGDTKSRTQPFAVAVSMLLVAVAIIIGGAYTSQTTQTTTVQASSNLKHAMLGTIQSIDIPSNTFVLSFGSTEDSVFADAGTDPWRVQLPPGEGFRLQKTQHIQVCSVMPDIHGNVSQATSLPCAQALRPKAEVIVDYLMLKKDMHFMVARKIYTSPVK